MTLSRGSQWEATDRRCKLSASHAWQEAVTQGGLALNQLDPQTSMDSIAPTLVVKTPSLEPSDATPPAAPARQPRRNAKGRVLRAASSLAPDMKSSDGQSQGDSSQTSQILGLGSEQGMDEKFITDIFRIRWDTAEKMLADPNAFLAELKDARCALPLSAYNPYTVPAYVVQSFEQTLTLPYFDYDRMVERSYALACLGAWVIAAVRSWREAKQMDTWTPPDWIFASRFHSRAVQCFTGRSVHTSLALSQVPVEAAALRADAAVAEAEKPP
eukprot:Skav202102  [mRNA]  locus=scaffold1980:49034:54007:+ [translate_table: standard]